MTNLSSEELARYSRQIILRELGVKGQEKLKHSRVLIIGMGGLGSPASLYLAAAGVGTLGLADYDLVERNNLHRQIIHQTATIGQSKLKSAGEHLQALNPHCRLEYHSEGIQPHNARELLSQYDLVVDGSDNFSTRYLVTDAACLEGIPLVYGSIFQFEGQVTFFHPQGGTPCYRCLFPVPPEPGSVPNCAEAGVLGALPGVVGSLQAMEAIKWIAGIGTSLAARLLVFEALTMEFRTLNIKKDPDCPLCGKNPGIRKIQSERYATYCEPAPVGPTANAEWIDLGNPPFEIEVGQAKALLEDPTNNVALLDVREDFEVEICSLEDSAHLPMRQVPQSWESLPRDRPLIVYCHHGGRSGQITKFLRAKGLNQTMNLAGGIDQWSRKIDPSMPRY